MRTLRISTRGKERKAGRITEIVEGEER